MGIAAGRNWAAWNQGLTLVVGLTNFDASGGLARSIGVAVFSGLGSLELLKLVTNDEGLERRVPSLADSSTTSWLELTE